MHWTAILAVLTGAAALVAAADQPRPLMTTDEALSLPQPAADRRCSYGPDELNFGELRVPDGAGPFPVVIVIHGGCWLAAYDLGYISSLAAELTRSGFATWSIEYRRVGDPGGGWPGTFADVARAADALRDLAQEHALDLDRVLALGHSAGGHLALWLGARPALDPTDELRGADPLRLRGVVSLAGITDLGAFASPDGCGSAVPGLLGGDPADHADRLARTSPIAMPSSGIPEILVLGQRDPIVPRSQADRYIAEKSESRPRLVEIAGAGHFELIDPTHSSWTAIHRSVVTVLGADLDSDGR
ncbi:MAG: alpha/beta hydrolase [Thermoanaerobaculales bacterium]|jgi:acetyl esterase/lipase|nr:alpha/beta hydrolase [Thermoanaerobaculales bacterium]